MTTPGKSTKKTEGNQRDKRLLQWMKSDLQAGFNRVAEVYWKQLNQVAAGVLWGSRLLHLTEDVVQEALISAYKDLLYRTEKSREEKLSTLQLRAWLYTIVRNKAIKCLERGEAHLELSVGLLGEEIEEQGLVEGELTRYDDPAYCHERWETMVEARREVQRLLAGLSPVRRAIVERKYLSSSAADPEKITYQQIAEEMNKPVGTVKSEASRAMAQMREQLEARRTESDIPPLAKLG
jgi:RNA polymerase sigma factor (sigma-70 family)